jgi:hypothetical protein
MLNDRSSKIALAISLLLHVLLLAPIWEDLGLVALLRRAPPPVAEEPEPLRFQFVDPQPGPEREPEEPTPLVSTADRRAAQPEAPADLPDGEAFQEGITTLPVTPREVGNPSPTPPGEPERAEAVEEPARDAETELAERGREETEGRTGDQRLALRRNPIGADRESPGRPGAESRLPVPSVDQRLTRAASGSTFSLNTMAWDWAPYIARLKAQIEEHISPPAAFYYGTAAWATQIKFRIGPTGKLLALGVVDHRGVTNLQYVAHDAVEGAADFEPLPPDFPESYLEITGNFYFNTFPSTGR